MDQSRVVVEARDPSFRRVAQVDLGVMTGGKFVKRVNAVGAWTFGLPRSHPACAYLQQPGSGVVVWLDGQVYLSGPMVTWQEVRSSDDPTGTTTFTGPDDLAVLAWHLAMPVPLNDYTQQTSANDVRTGPLETISKQYVDLNVGPSARPDRRRALADALTIAPDQGRGAKLTGSPRFDQVGALLQSLAALDGTYRFDVVQSPTVPNTVFDLYPISDRSAAVRMDVDNDLLKSATAGVSGPTATWALVAGQGDGAARTLVAYTDDDAAAAEALWGYRVETFIDQRQTDDQTQLLQAGQEAVQDGGRTTLSLKVVPQDGDTMRYGPDWQVGDRVAVVVDGQPLADTVTEAVLLVGPDAVTVGATVGDPVGYDWETEVTRRFSDLSTRVGALERAS